MIEHEPYFKEIYMFSMCPLIVFMIFAAKCKNFPQHVFWAKVQFILIILNGCADLFALCLLLLFGGKLILEGLIAQTLLWTLSVQVEGLINMYWIVQTFMII